MFSWTQFSGFLLIISLGAHGARSSFPCQSNLPYDFVDIDRFTDNMCAQCLWFMAGSSSAWHDHSNSSDWWMVYNHSANVNVALCAPTCEPFSYDRLLNESYWVRSKLRSEFYVNILLDCCAQARRCCSSILEDLHDHRVSEEMQHCPAKWDGFACWNSSLPGNLNHQPCPGMTFIASAFEPTPCRQETASKQCLTNGTWNRIWSSHISGNQTVIYDREYTDYFRCSTPGATHKLRFIRVKLAFYFISTFFALISLVVVIKFGPNNQRKLLKFIHINFFVSLILTCVCTILVLILIKERHYNLDSMVDRNPLWCRLLICFRKAARLANYCWMLNEGIILWQMIVTPFNKWKQMGKFYAIGWGLPVVVMAIYSLIHSQPRYNTHCWSKTMGLWEYVYSVPPITIILINVCLLFNMAFVLFQKLSSSDQELRSAVRASLFLVPVFGFQYVFYIVPFDPFESCSVTLFCAHYAMIVTEALQGAMVACIFCFFNSEIQENVRKAYQRRRIRTSYRTSNANSVNRQETVELNRSSTSDESRKSSG